MSDDEKEYEARLRRRLKILKQEFDSGRVKFAPGLKVIESLKAVKSGPDGEIDLATVDGLVRSLALAVTHHHDSQQLKAKFPLADIQTSYFEFIERNFGEFYKVMVDRGLTPHDTGIAISRSAGAVEEFNRKLPEFLDVIEEFWRSVSDVVYMHVEDMDAKVKGIFGGDLFPAHDENIASKCSIYTDTIILPDPFLRTKHVFEAYDPTEKAYFLIKHGVNLLQYKELACADVTPPIVVVLPDVQSLDMDERKFTLELGKADAIIHAGKLFGRGFASFEELMDFCEGLDTVEKALAQVTDKRRLLFDTEWSGSAEDQIRRALADKNYRMASGHPGRLLALQATSRMAVSNELLLKTRRLRGTPIIDVPTSWQYLVWKMECDAGRAETETGAKDLHVTQGLQHLAETEMEWLGKVPVDALIEIRKQGALAEIRELLGKGVGELIRENPSNFFRSRDQVFDNIHEAFDQHRANVRQLLDKKMRFAGRELGSWLVLGTLGITAAATGAPVWALLAIAADQLLDAPKLKDIPAAIKALAEENRQLNQSPVGLLFAISKRG
jgi:hypothetical protein